MKVTVLGAAGGIGQALTLLLKNQLPVNSILSLYDIAPITPGIAVDLSHIPTSVKVKGFTGKDIMPTLYGSDIVLIAAGVARKPGLDRNDLFKFNASIICNLVTQIIKICPETLIAIITNPINSTVAIAAEVLKKAGVYNKNKLFGITTLDSIRSNTFVAKLKDKQPQNITVPVIGGHSGLTILPLLSQIPNIIFTEEEITNLTKSIQNAGTEVVKAKAGGGSATLSMGEAAARFTLSLVYALQGASNIIEYAYVDATEKDGKYKYAPFFAQPILLDKDGIAERKDLGILSSYEQEILQKMLKVLNKDIALGKDYVNSLFL
ncbi:malate dehydrogenase [Candidatus Fukatsuia anoeciicola]|uniref:malate dehydrogenase n=1 Tax=Candidatus Fukatsuia anoeciicola TaxID=2994492 RepID=UPI00346494D0